jgi:3-hydroxyethyl bacteriochlorophyllide a dehydrogenase
VLGRLLARLTVAAGAPQPVPSGKPTPTAREGGAEGYTVIHPDADERRDYAASMTPRATRRCSTTLISRLKKGGEICLAGFYESAAELRLPARLHEGGAPARRRRMEARRTSWQPAALIEEGALSSGRG